MHGVRSTSQQRTDFEDDEFVIYNTVQQHMSYLVEFCIPSQDANKTKTITLKPRVSSSNEIRQSDMIVFAEDHRYCSY